MAAEYRVLVEPVGSTGNWRVRVWEGATVPGDSVVVHRCVLDVEKPQLEKHFSHRERFKQVMRDLAGVWSPL